MKKVSVPITGGEYQVSFPETCVYCGTASDMRLRETVSAGSGQRRRYVTVDVPYCAAHARQSRRNTRILSLGWIVILIFSCAVLFGVTTSINRNPPTLLLVLLALVAAGLAFLGSRVLRQVLSRSRPSMADMLGSSHLGIHVEPAGDELVFSFANDEIADQFARLNGQAPSA
jgi:hypothetical protein